MTVYEKREQQTLDCPLFPLFILESGEVAITSLSAHTA